MASLWEATVKTCKDCGETKPLEEFNRHKQTRDGRNVYCKPCHRARAKAWQRGPGKQSHAEAVKRWRRTTGAESRATTDRNARAKWPEKAAARGAVNWAVRTGRLVRPDACLSCGDMGPVQGHHHNGYVGEAALDVVWLCSTCHAAVHRVEVAA